MRVVGVDSGTLIGNSNYGSFANREANNINQLSSGLNLKPMQVRPIEERVWIRRAAHYPHDSKMHQAQTIPINIMQAAHEDSIGDQSTSCRINISHQM